jgi:hypothetical protein
MNHKSKSLQDKNVTAIGALPTVVQKSTHLISVIYATHGITIEVGANTAELLEQLIERLPNGSQPALDCKKLSASFSVQLVELANDRKYYQLYREREMLSDASDLAEICDHFESTIGIYVAENSLNYVFIHAGCVSWNGKGILIPGRSYTGKTSLVATFLKFGATYYSDEFGLLDDKGMVHAYPRSLSLRTQSQSGRLRMAAEEIGALTGSVPIPIGHVLVTTYQPDGQWNPQVLTAGQTLLALLDNAVCARTDPERTLRLSAKIAGSALGLSGNRGEAGACVSRFFDLLGTPSNRR